MDLFYIITYMIKHNRRCCFDYLLDVNMRVGFVLENEEMICPPDATWRTDRYIR